MGGVLQNFIIQICYCAVPIFFIFSGYFSGKKTNYFSFMRKKFISVFLPYCIWMVLYFLYFNFGKLLIMKISPTLIHNDSNIFFKWTITDWIHNFLGFAPVQNGDPWLAGQFWFLRDLFCFSILFPFFVLTIKKIPYLWLVSVFIFSSLFTPLCNAHLFTSLFYFSLGIFFGHYDIDFFEIVDDFPFFQLGLLFIGTFILLIMLPNSLNYLSTIEILITVMIILKMSKLSMNSVFLLYLSDYSLFLYLIHMPIIKIVVQKVWLHFFPMINTFFVLFEFFGAAICIIVVSTFIGICLKKVFPRIYSCLIGMR